MDLLIACHCERLHRPLVTKIPSGQEIPIDLDPNVRSIEYVDVSCPEKTWDMIQSTSKDIIWTMHCPLYAGIYWSDHENSGVLRAILQNSWRILKPGGILIIPIGTTPGSIAIKKGPVYTRLVDNKQGFIDSINAVIAQHPSTPFEVQLVSSDHSFYIKKEYEHIMDSLFLLRKPYNLSGGAKKIYRKSKTKKIRKIRNTSRS